MPLHPSDPPADENNDDPFAEFPSEPNEVPEIPKHQDWFSEFPDEKTNPVARSKTWSQLSRNLKNDNDGR